MKKTIRKLSILALSCILAMPISMAVSAAGGIYPETPNIELKAGETKEVVLVADGVEGKYTITATGPVKAEGSGEVKPGNKNTIKITGTEKGTGTVAISYDVFNTGDGIELWGDCAISVAVSEPEKETTAEKAAEKETTAEKEAVTEKATEKETAAEKAAGTEGSGFSNDFEINGAAYNLVASFANISIPDGCTAAEKDFKGKKIPVLKYGDAELYAMREKGSKNNIAYVSYDEATDTFYKPEILFQEGKLYFISGIPDGFEIPEGYEAKTCSMKGIDVEAFVKSGSNEKYQYFFATCSGVCNLYCFETTEQTVQKTDAGKISMPPAAPVEQDEAAEAAAEKTDGGAAPAMPRGLAILIICVGIAVMVLAFFIGKMTGGKH